jgi:hypothetical protein
VAKGMYLFFLEVICRSSSQYVCFISQRKLNDMAFLGQGMLRNEWSHGQIKILLVWKKSFVLVARACNPSYLGSWDWENLGSRSAWAISSQDPVSKLTAAKWTGDEDQAVECLLCKCEALSSNPSRGRDRILRDN